MFHDRTGCSVPVETNLELKAFPSPADLWTRYRFWKGLDAQAEQIVLQDYFDDGSGKAPRYYQVNAVNAAIEAIAKGRDRVLLVMATGTGKTYTAFQILWRLWKAGRRKRILFLADRNVLIDQTMVNDFRRSARSWPSSRLMRRPSNGRTGPVDLPLALDRKRRIDPSFEVYLGSTKRSPPRGSAEALQGVLAGLLRLIVIDECHRGSAADDSAWREILTHFSAATQVGLTATPQETKYISNIDYFGDPVFTYSLRQGISDGFLAPYKVVKVHIDRDVEGYRPQIGQRDRDGNEVEDRLYNTKDFDRNLVLDDRTVLTARKVTEFLKESGDRFQKTILFCVDEEHAARMRQALVNENADLVTANARYIMRITGSDKEGQDQLGNFIDPESLYPVLVTTSRLLSTGVDAQTCRLIVLDRAVGSMTEFKQIVGRGYPRPRGQQEVLLHADRLPRRDQPFRRSGLRWQPVQIYVPGKDDPITPPDGFAEGEQTPFEPPEGETVIDQPGPLQPPGLPTRKVYVDGVGARIVAERVEYLDEAGRLVTESLRDFTRRRCGSGSRASTTSSSAGSRPSASRR